jgi:hypothetical protein
VVNDGILREKRGDAFGDRAEGIVKDVPFGVVKIGHRTVPVNLRKGREEERDNQKKKIEKIEAVKIGVENILGADDKERNKKSKNQRDLGIKN